MRLAKSSYKKRKAHWLRDQNLRDVLIHLYEWHQLLLSWVISNQNGEENLSFLLLTIGEAMAK
ncbi:ClbS/DfsB family four-helix bundle protein [Enterococcus termitis]